MAVTMVKLSNSSCRPLLQGMMLLALLLLSLMAFVDAQGAVVEVLVNLEHKAQGVVIKKLVDLEHKAQGAVDVEEVEEPMAKKALKTALNKSCKKQGWKPFCNGAKMGIRVHKYSCKAQGLMDKLNPGGFDRFLAIDLSMSFPPSFRYPGIGNSVVICWRSAEPQAPAAAAAGTGATTLFPSSRYSYP